MAEDLLQRWRCPDCRAVFDVFVDSSTGRADEMADELCPSCDYRGKKTIGIFDSAETALYDGDAS